MSTVDPTNPPSGQEMPFLRAAIVTVAGDLIASGGVFGLPLTADRTNALLTLVNSVSALVFLVLTVRAHRRVTPLSNPQTVIDGVAVPLVPAFLPGSPTGPIDGAGASSVG
ncbi:hypothetical protein [Dactylosporangium sp. CS-033363]|uniref:hypothetical protein n=1 Tax=Dactylosporangium sp. CS-033363 TaxID=3239935 RepID=UPI003D911CB8